MKLLKITVTIALLSLPTIVQASDSPARKACLTRAAATRTANIAAGMKRSDADKKWEAAVNKCRSIASVDSTSIVAYKPAPKVEDPAPKTKGPKRLTSAPTEGVDRDPRGKTVPTCSTNGPKPRRCSLLSDYVAQVKEGHYVPPGRRGAPSNPGTPAGGGSRLV